MSEKKIVDWLRNLPESEKIQSIKVEIGERGSAHLVGVLTFDDNPEETGKEIISLSTDSGWGTEHPKMRCYALNEQNNIKRTKQITIPINGQRSTQVSDIQAIMIENRKGQTDLLHCIIEQARIQSRSLDTLSESLAHREFALATVLETMIEAERETAEVNAANMILEHHLDQGDPPQENAYQSAAAKVLEGLATNLVPGMGKPDETAPTEDQIKAWYQSDIWFKTAVDDVVKEDKENPHPVPPSDSNG